MNVLESNKRDVKDLSDVLKNLGISPPACSSQVGPGWLPHVERCLKELISLGWRKELLQVKQKFCQLRIYASGVNQDMRAAITKAERLCAEACEECGRPHGILTPTTGRALCITCEREEPQE